MSDSDAAFSIHIKASYWFQHNEGEEQQRQY